MAWSIQVRRGTAAEWTTANPVLLPGEPGLETDTGRFKFGNGTDPWAALEYAAADAGLVGNFDGGAADTVFGGIDPIDCGGA